MYKVQVTPLIGLPRFDGWAHVATISSGNVVFALSVEGQHARNIGRDLVDLINQNEVISSGAELYKLVTKIIQDARDKEGALSLACGFLVQEGKSTFCVFNGSISLKREGKSGQLLQSGNQLQIIEGTAQLEDIYVFATNQAAQFLGEVKQKFDQGYDADTIVTSITPSLHLEETTATSAMAFIDFRNLIQEKKPEVSKVMPKSAPVEELVIPPFSSEVEAKQETKPEPTIFNDIKKPVVVKDKNENSNELLKSASWLVQDSEKPIIDVKKPEERVQQKITFSKISSLLKTGVKKLRSIGANSAGLLKKIVRWRPPVAGEVYVGKAANTKKIRVFIFIGLIAILIAAGGGFFFYQRSQKMVEASTLLEPFLLEIEQVKATVEANPIESRQKLQQIISSMESLEATLEDNQIAQKKVATSIEDAQKLYDDISGREEFSELPIFFTSRDQELDILITNSELIDDKFVFFDRQKKQGVLVDNQGEVVSSFTTPIESEVKDISVEFDLDDLWILANSIFVADPTQEEVPAEELEDNDRLDKSTMIAAFGNALYIFNADERTIFKYSQSDNGFDDPVRWIRSVPGLDFEQIVDVMIDGDVWLTSNTGEIFRLRSGNRQDFSFSGLEQPFSSSIYIYSQEELENLYLLEPAENRVVITDKDGVFIREITSSSLAAASHIIVSNDEKKLLAISGSTVYVIEL